MCPGPLTRPARRFPPAPPAAGRQVAMLREQQRALVRELRPNALALVS